MQYFDGLLIVGISIATAFLCEGISWILIYRTAKYKNILSSLDRNSKKVEILKGKSPLAAKKSKSKKIDRFESSLKDANQSLSSFKFQSGGVVGITLLLIFGLLSSLFDGKAVAKLPFVPFRFFQKMTHRGLPGEDATDCAMVFFYMLCSISIRPNLQKLLGFSPPRSAAGPNPFAPPEAKAVR
eukprot:jgi/Mesen1/4458/ME000227S03478